jgi:hypothetical protein
MWPTLGGHTQGLTFRKSLKSNTGRWTTETEVTSSSGLKGKRSGSGLDSKLFPAAESVEVTHVAPTLGSKNLTLSSVIGGNSAVPDNHHLSGNTRFKISGKKIVSSNIP